MNRAKKNLVAITVASALGLVAIGDAQADAYAVAYDRIFNFNIAGLDDDDIGGIVFTSNSNASSFFSGFAGCANADDTDAAKCSVGPDGDPTAGGGANGFTTRGQGLNYADADAVILSLPPEPDGEAINMAEESSNLERDPPTIAQGDAGNDLSVVGELLIGGGGDGEVQLTFEFDAEPYVAVKVHDDELPGPDSALASIAFSITITDSTGGIVFSWDPDGIVNEPGETADDYDLNVDFAQIGAGEKEFDSGKTDGTGSCNGGAVGAAGINFSTCTPGHFSMTTDVFTDPGEYTLTVSMAENASDIQVVPEPAALFLFGTGFLGMAALRRRRNQR